MSAADDLHTRAVLATDLSFTISDIRAPDQPLVWVNPAFTRTTGYAEADAVGRNCRFLQGAGTDPAAVEQMRAAIRAGVPTTVQLLNYRADGTPFWNEVSLAPIFDADGRCTHVVGVQADVTERVDADRQREEAFASAARALASEREALASERKAREEAERAQQRLALMAEATTLLSATLDAREALERLAALLVPLMADWVAINLVDPDGSLAAAATRHRDGRFEALATYARLQRETLTPDAPLRQVLRTGKPVLRSPITAEQAAAHTTSPELVAAAVELGMSAALYVPLTARSRVLGVITLVVGPGGRLFDTDDLQQVADLGRRAALAVDNARLYAAEHATALTLQRSLLPQVPAVPGLDLGALYLPGAASAEVGGDWYDVLTLPDGAVGLAIGDVMGHDLAAASAMGQLRSVLRSYAWEGDRPAQVLDRLDRLVVGLGMAQLATCVYARLSMPTEAGGPARLTWANAGHHPPLLRLPDGTVRRLSGGEGLVIGVGAGGDRGEADTAMPAGGVLLLFTDGLVESRHRDLSAGVDEVAAVLAAHDPAAGAQSLVDALGELAAQHGGDDDVCLLAVRID